ncbi:MAG: cation transporter [candidate division Zixibacteria bacterium]
MKITFKLLLTGLAPAVILIYLTACAATKPDFAELISEGNEIRIYEIFGMDCPGCHGGLENLVNKVPGVISSEANWEKQQLRVVLYANVEVDDNAIYEAIKRANFTPGQRFK